MKSILVVDDAITNLKFVENILKDEYKLILVKSGEKALKYLENNYVDLILLDLLMPEMDGIQVFEALRKMEQGSNVPVVFLTANVDVENEIKCLELGAVDFIRKPLIPEIMKNRINHILQLEELKKGLQNKVKEKTIQVEQLTFEIISTIAGMIEARDSYTKGHSIRVAEYSALLAKRLGWSEVDVQNLKYVALLHDIGKVGIPDNILNKPGRLTEKEFHIIKSHTTIGGEILKDIETIPGVDEGAKYHHERYDGKGYPCGYVGEHIPEVARIICVADAYDAMCSKRVYRDKLPLNVIRKEIKEGGGTQFDPFFAETFIQLLDEGALEINFNEAESKKTISGEGHILISQIMQSIEEETKKAETCDYLTGLLRRKEGEAQINSAIQKKPGCLAFVDLDNLKRTNDTMGHLAGDYALKTVGEVLAEHGEETVICRMGGDEFLFYMIGVDKQKATDTIEKVLRSFEERKKKNTYLSASSLSIGLCMTDERDNYSTVFKRADRALYHVKQSGKCGYFFYNREGGSDDNKGAVDLQKLVHNLKAQGGYRGALSVEYREFAKIYDFVQHLGERYSYQLHLVMITLEMGGGEEFYIDEKENAMLCMEQTIKASLRAVDVSTRFSSDQFIVVLMNAKDEDMKLITDRIRENFYKIYEYRHVNVHFDTADLSTIGK